MQHDAIMLKLSGSVSPDPAIGKASANCERETERGMDLELDPVSWVILALVALHVALDAMRFTVTMFTKRGT